MTNEAGLSVSELNLIISEAVRRDPRTRSVLVRGEVSGFRNQIASGHWYFSLKDAQASIGCAMFRNANLRAQIRPKDGDQVLAEGYVDFYAPQGKMQLVLIPVSVQGTGAGKELAEGIRKATETDADVIIVARGGGSAEDLWCFNDEIVARAVATSEKPVVSGVGHEIDTSLCDLAADVRASTPSNAAEIVFPDSRELQGRVNLMRSALTRAETAEIRKAELKLTGLRQRLSALSPEKRIALLESRRELLKLQLCGAIGTRLENAAKGTADARNALKLAVSGRMKDAEHTAARLRERLTAVSPLAVLNRGYALVYDQEEKILTRAEEAKTRKEMTLQFADGRVAVTGKGTV